MTGDADPPQRHRTDQASRPEPAGEPKPERLAPARGILLGLLLAVVFWVIVIAAIVLSR